MLPPRYRLKLLVLLGCVALAAPAAARSPFPALPITMVVPFPADGPVDRRARIVADKMSSNLGVPILVVNKDGLDGNQGVTSVARDDPDGYTILLGTEFTHALNPALHHDLPYDALADFAPISLLVTFPNVLLVNPQLPAQSVEELLGLLRAKPGAYSYASAGDGTPMHLAGELFKSVAGVEIVHVPYKSAGPALVDLLGNHVTMLFASLQESVSYLKDGRLRGLAVTTADRAPSMPDLPTMAEAGLPGYQTSSWDGLFAPAGTPPEVVARLNEAAVAALADPDLQGKLLEFGAMTVGSTPEALGAHVKDELAKWRPLTEAAGAQTD